MNLCLPHMTAHSWPAPPGTNPTLLSHRDSLHHTEVLSCHFLPLSASLEVYSAFFARQALTSTSLAISKMCLQRPLQLLHGVILSGPLCALVMHSHQTLLSLHTSHGEKPIDPIALRPQPQSHGKLHHAGLGSGKCPAWGQSELQALILQ